MTASALLLALLLVAAEHTAATTLTLHAKKPRTRQLPLHVVHALIDKYAKHYGIPRTLAHRLVRVESGYRQNAVSRKGARGVMQLRPSTARGLRVNIYDTEQNIEGGMRYLRQMYDRFKRWDLALAAYHSGPTKVARYKGVPPKSRRYVRAILNGVKYPPPPKVAAKPKPATPAKPATAIPAKPAAPTPQALAGPAEPQVIPVAAEAPEPPRLVWRRREMDTGEAQSTTVEIVEYGQPVRRIEEMVIQDGKRVICIRREFRIVEGIWKLISEQTVIRLADGTEVDHSVGSK